MKDENGSLSDYHIKAQHIEMLAEEIGSRLAQCVSDRIEAAGLSDLTSIIIMDKIRRNAYHYYSHPARMKPQKEVKSECEIMYEVGKLIGKAFLDKQEKNDVCM